MEFSTLSNRRIATLVAAFCYFYFSVSAIPFKCSSTSTCNAVVDYLLPNTTTLSAVQVLFGVPNLFSILGANSLSLSTSPAKSLPANSTIRIPFPCFCTNGTGISHRIPTYSVVPGDGLYHIAAEVFSGLVTYQEIQAVNNITNPDLIEVGQKLWIPLPCSCDDVDGRKVVHYGHLVDSGSSVEGIAQEYNTTEDTLLKLNNLPTPKDLKAGSILDVPLRACESSVGKNSPDYPLLVPNGAYSITAGNCVYCNCNASSGWTLRCIPYELKPSLWQSCPNVHCSGIGNLSIGNTEAQNCNTTTCAYAGYTNQTILTLPVLDSTCPASTEKPSSSINLQSWKFNAVLIVFQVLLFLSL